MRINWAAVVTVAPLQVLAPPVKSAAGEYPVKVVALKSAVASGVAPSCEMIWFWIVLVSEVCTMIFTIFGATTVKIRFVAAAA